MSYSIPASFFDILPNDYLDMDCTGQLNSNADTGFGAPFSFPLTGGEMASSFATYDELPLFQAPPTFSSTSSVVESSSSISWDYPSSQSSSSSLVHLSSQHGLVSEADEREVRAAVAQAGKRKRQSDSVGRDENQTKRQGGTGFAKMFGDLSETAKQALVKPYECCRDVDTKDKSTLTKHWFSNRHYGRAARDDSELLDTQPVYTCPGFLSMHPLCKNAKAGRYDSANRHCKNCPGFTQIQAKCCESGMGLTPVQLTRGEFKAVQEFRKNARPGQETYSEPILNAIFKLLMVMATGSSSASTHMATSGGSSEEHAGVFIPDEVPKWFSSDNLDDDHEDVLFRF